MAEAVTEGEVQQMLAYFYRMHDVSKRGDSQLQSIQETCTSLFIRDYVTGRVPNHEGALCSTYPLEILVIEGEKTKAQKKASQNGIEENQNGKDASQNGKDVSQNGKGTGQNGKEMSQNGKTNQNKKKDGRENGHGNGALFDFPSPKKTTIIGFAPQASAALSASPSPSPSPSPSYSSALAPSFTPTAAALSITKQAVVAPRDGSPSILGKSLLKTSAPGLSTSSPSSTTNSPSDSPSPISLSALESDGVNVLPAGTKGPSWGSKSAAPGLSSSSSTAPNSRGSRVIENNYPKLRDGHGKAPNHRQARGGMNQASLDDIYLPVSASLDSGGYIDEEEEAELEENGSVGAAKDALGGVKIAETSITSEVLQEYLENCKYSRVWSRFPVPVIYCRKKHICRSSALSTNIEVMLNAMREKTTMFIFGQPSPSSAGLAQGDANTFEESFKESSDRKTTPTGQGLPQSRQEIPADAGTQSIHQQRMNDISLLKYLGVKSICDLMVESKKVKYFVNVCSSEKADSEKRYQNAGFEIIVAPYPGCEFFCLFKNQKHCARKLHFDWKQNPSHVVIDIPKNVMDSVQWADYREWDLVLLSQNYLRLLLRYIEDPNSDSGLLVHCISGWDRTPLFISLLRMSLWADGEAHQSLSAVEILYLTIGYDWLLFSHLLNDRKRKGEDIFDFCFYFLMFIEGSEFSLKDTEELDVSLPEHSPRCRNNESRPSPDSKSSKKKEADIFQIRGNSWQMVSDLGSLGTSLPRRDSFNFIGDDETFRVPSSERLDTTPVHSISECDCCVDRKDDVCEACAVANFPISRQARLARRRQRLKELRRLFAKIHEQVFPKSKPTQGPGGVLNWILGK